MSPSFLISIFKKKLAYVPTDRRRAVPSTLPLRGCTFVLTSVILAVGTTIGTERHHPESVIEYLKSESIKLETHEICRNVC